MVASLLTGLGSLVDFVQNRTGKTTEWHLGGWSNLNDETIRFITMSSLASYVPDAALAILFEDCRLPRQCVQVRDAMATELDWLETRSNYLWATVSEVFSPSASMSCGRFRSEVLDSANISAAFFDWRALTPASREP